MLSYWLCVIVNVLVAAVANTVLVGFDIPSNMSCCGFVFSISVKVCVFISYVVVVFSLLSQSSFSTTLPERWAPSRKA